jgi:hypothetical protein
MGRMRRPLVVMGVVITLSLAAYGLGRMSHSSTRSTRDVSDRSTQFLIDQDSLQRVRIVSQERLDLLVKRRAQLLQEIHDIESVLQSLTRCPTLSANLPIGPDSSQGIPLSDLARDWAIVVDQHLKRTGC